MLEHDHIVIVGPTFPHEVVGFSGGAKYFFPGISGPDVINATHWLGALATVRRHDRDQGHPGAGHDPCRDATPEDAGHAGGPDRLKGTTWPAC